MDDVLGDIFYFLLVQFCVYEDVQQFQTNSKNAIASELRDISSMQVNVFENFARVS